MARRPRTASRLQWPVGSWPAACSGSWHFSLFRMSRAPYSYTLKRKESMMQCKAERLASSRTGQIPGILLGPQEPPSGPRRESSLCTSRNGPCLQRACCHFLTNSTASQMWRSATDNGTWIWWSIRLCVTPSESELGLLLRSVDSWTTEDFLKSRHPRSIRSRVEQKRDHFGPFTTPLRWTSICALLQNFISNVWWWGASTRFMSSVEFIETRVFRLGTIQSSQALKYIKPMSIITT
mmetsp:Transcript_10408/g.20982  ORF Transcript_10408/g.20982 Transcript_10408/m.20982 type:complete len:237 (+) Transcript_10408:382-1092(+)